MNITQEQFKLLIQVYNALLNINTKGEDTVLMGTCLQAFKKTLMEMEQGIVEVKE